MAGGPSNGVPVAISPSGQWVLVATSSAQAATFDHDVLYSTATGKSVALPAGSTIQPGVCPNNRAGQFTGYAVDNSGRAWGTWSETQTTGATTSCLTVPAAATASGGGPLTGSSFTTASLGTCSYPTSDASDRYGLSGQMFLSSGGGIAVGQALADCPNPPPPIGPGPASAETFIESNGGGSFSEVWNQEEQTNLGNLAGINDSGTILAGPGQAAAGVYEWKGNAAPADVLPGYDLFDSAASSEINDQGNLLVSNGSSSGLYQPAANSFTAISGAVSLNNHNEVVAEGGPTNPPSVWTPQGGSESVTILNAAAVGMTGTFLPSAVADNGDLVGTAQSGGGAWHDYLLTPGTWVVNSTGLQDDTATALANGACDINLTGPPVCTLRAAIEVANQDEGGSITFDIPAGHGNTFDGAVPQIRDPKGTGMPTVGSASATSGISIDGTTQPGAGKVELSGTSANNTVTSNPTVGLTLAATGTAVKGLVINGYSNGIDVTAPGAAIQGDWLRTNAGDTAADPNPLGTNTRAAQLAAQIGIDLSSQGSQIGGAAAGQGDVLATGRTSGTPGQFRPSAALVDTSGGNVIQGNSIGVVPGTQTALVDPATGALFVTTGAVGITGADTVGGTATGDRNVLAPASAIAGASVAQGDTFLGTLLASGPVQIGGATTTAGTGRGNVFMPTPYGTGSGRELEISGIDGVVQGNRFDPTGQPAIVDTGSVTIGGSAPDDGNLIEDAATDPPGPGGLPGVDGAITIGGSANKIENNVLTSNGGWGAVQVRDGDGDTITRNQMTGNPHGIEFGTLGYVYDTDVTKTQSGPNDLEYYPILFSTSSTSAGTTVSGRIEQPGTVTVDLYSQTNCGLQAEAEGQGEHYLGSTTVSSTLGGEDFSFTAAAAASGQDAITATATAANGSTSEFSPCLITNSQAPTLLGYGVRPPSSTVPITVTAAAARQAATATGKGTLWLLCPALTTGSCTGTAVIKTTGTKPATITKQGFTMAAGSAAKITVKITGAPLTQLESAHQLTVNLTTTAQDAATPPHSQTYHQALTLTDP